jgi:hypothetical protein
MRAPVRRRAKVEDEEEFPAEPEDDEEEDAPAAEADGEEESGDASLEEVMTTKPGEGVVAEEEEESILSLGREDRIETLSVRVEPKKDTEFVCQKCYLVKPIRSQLADKKRMYCRDCA